MHFFPSNSHITRIKIHFHFTPTEPLPLPLDAAPAQHCSDASEQLRCAERLGDIVPMSEVERTIRHTSVPLMSGMLKGFLASARVVYLIALRH